jgi:hypothetical protein
MYTHIWKFMSCVKGGTQMGGISEQVTEVNIRTQEDVTGSWMELHSEESHSLYYSVVLYACRKEPG